MTTTERPREVTLHAAVSLDGRIDGFEPDVAAFYQLAAPWNEDATLAGSETILCASGVVSDDADAPRLPPPSPDDARPLLVVADTRGRVRCYTALLEAGYWRGAVALCAAATPPEHIAYLSARGVPAIRAGSRQVDLGLALAELTTRFGVQRVRADTGGTLAAALLRADVVTTLSLLIHPIVVGAGGRPFFRALGELEASLRWRTPAVEARPDGLVWLRYTKA